MNDQVVDPAVAQEVDFLFHRVQQSDRSCSVQYHSRMRKKSQEDTFGTPIADNPRNDFAVAYMNTVERADGDDGFCGRMKFVDGIENAHEIFFANVADTS